MLEFLFLGLVQGILEWLPVSSEGFVVMAFLFLGEGSYVDLALYLHLGTLLAVVVYFRCRIARLLRERGREAWFIGYATLASLLVGLPVYLGLDFLAESVGQWVGVFLLALTGLALLVTGFLVKKKVRKFSKGSWKKHALWAGLLQGFSVIPGLSRSGVTMFALLSQGYEQEKALQTSFLMSIPVVLAANLFLGLKPFLLGSQSLVFQPAYVMALLTAFLAGLVSIHFLLVLARRIDFSWFCWFFGILSLLGVGVLVL